MNLLKKSKQRKNKLTKMIENLPSIETPSEEVVFTDMLQTNLEGIKTELGNCTDLVTRPITVGTHELAIVYIEGLANSDLINKSIIKPLTSHLSDSEMDKEHFFNNLSKKIITNAQVKEKFDRNELLLSVLSGDTLLLVNGHTEGIIIATKGWQDRGVMEPSSQNVVRGPKDAFSETLRTNTALIRRRLKHPSLRIDSKRIGKLSSTDVAIVYLEGIVDPAVVTEVKRRLDGIDIDAILEGGYIEELIQDKTLTPFPTMFNSERPDSVVSNILEGKVAILVDGTPFVMTVPAFFVEYFQASEDYYHRADFASFIRLLRFVSFLMALLIPSAYIAVTTFHQEMLPTSLLISLAANHEGVPFPAVVEVIIMELTFEILREAGIRLPKAVGTAISIVGALVIGESAVTAGLVSPAMVIVVSFTAITSFVIPSYDMGIAVRMLRFVFIFLAATFGLYGIVLGIIVLVLHLCSLSSFGVPYMLSVGPFHLSDQKDSLIRLPWSMLKKRPSHNKLNPMRQPENSSENGG